MKVILTAFISLWMKKKQTRSVLAKWSNVMHSNVVLNMLSFVGQKSLQSKWMLVCIFFHFTLPFEAQTTCIQLWKINYFFFKELARLSISVLLRSLCSALLLLWTDWWLRKKIQFISKNRMRTKTFTFLKRGKLFSFNKKNSSQKNRTECWQISGYKHEKNSYV